MTGLFDLDGVVSTDVDESTNRLRVGVETADLIPVIEAQIAGLGVPREAALIEVTEPIFQLATLRDQTRPLAGGLQIHFYELPGARTASTWSAPPTRAS